MKVFPQATYPHSSNEGDIGFDQILYKSNSPTVGQNFRSNLFLSPLEYLFQAFSKPPHLGPKLLFNLSIQCPSFSHMGVGRVKLL